MIKHLFVLSVAALMGCNSVADKQLTASLNGNSRQTELKRYDVKSGIVHYKTTISGNVMGGKVSGNGLGHLYFKDWGAVELKEEESTQTTEIKVFGSVNKETSRTHEMSKLDNGTAYYVDFEQKKILENQDAAMGAVKAFGGGNALKAGKDMLESSGGKKIGNENILGYNCEVWEVQGLGKMWLYKGVLMKADFQMMGIRTLTEAVEAKFDINVPSSHFRLPDFPVEKMEGMMGGMDDDDLKEARRDAARYKNMTYEEFKAKMISEDPTAAEMSEEEMRQSYKMFKAAMERLSE